LEAEAHRAVEVAAWGGWTTATVVTLRTKLFTRFLRVRAGSAHSEPQRYRPVPCADALFIIPETDLFPFWREHVSEPYRAGLTTNVDQHHLFARPLDACWLYVRRLRPLLDPKAGLKTLPSPVPEPPAVVAAIDPAEFGLDITKPFDPAALRREMDKWVPDCVRHMQEEIETLRPEFFDSMGKKRYMESEGILVKHLQAMDPTWFLVSCIGECRTTSDVLS
jgi:hypothetical protein